VTLATIRRAEGVDGMRRAIAAALAAHPTATEAAASLGTSPRALRRAAQRAGVAWPALVGQRPTR